MRNYRGWKTPPTTNVSLQEAPLLETAENPSFSSLRSRNLRDSSSRQKREHLNIISTFSAITPANAGRDKLQNYQGLKTLPTTLRRINPAATISN